MTLEQAEKELVSIMSENLDDLSIISLGGIFFVPQIISDLEQYDDIGIMVHIMIPASYENKKEDLKSVVISEDFREH
jgi:hypothetical protein